MFRFSLRLVLALVLLAGSGTAQEEVEFPSDYETTVDSQDIGDLSYDSEARRTLLSGSHWSRSVEALLGLAADVSSLMP